MMKTKKAVRVGRDPVSTVSKRDKTTALLYRALWVITVESQGSFFEKPDTKARARKPSMFVGLISVFGIAV